MIHRSRTAALLVVVALLAACSSGSSGPDLTAGVEESQPVTAVTDDTDQQEASGADASFTAAGSPSEVGAKITAKLGDPSDTLSEEISEYYLYSSGTVWVTPAADPARSLIAVYEDNDRAIRRHSALAGSAGWLLARNRIRSGGGSSSGGGNDFRGGGSGSGK